MYKRTISHQISDLITKYPVIILTGARQVGKSTEVFKFTKSHGFHYVSLDNISERQLALQDPVFFIQQHGTPLIIDEVQYAPILMEVIESLVNKKRLEEGNANGMFILTGSQNFSLMKGVTQSLAGRATILNMMPLSYSEIMCKNENPFIPSFESLKKPLTPLTVNELFKLIVRGFYPELYNNPNLESHVFYSNYINTYIDRDISEIINIKDKMNFHNFLQYIASMTSQQINYADIAKNLGIDSRTVKSWLSILQTSHIIYLLQPYSEYKLSKRITKSPKIYFCDTGLAAHLARIYNPEHLMVSNLAGAFMENYVMNEIMKSYTNNNKPFNAFYYRDNNQNEIDLIIQNNFTLHLIEIKKGSMFTLKHTKGFKQLENSQYETGTSCIICNTEDNYALTNNIYVLNVTTI